MVRQIIPIILMLITLVWVVNAAQTVTEDNFAEPVIEPKLVKYFLPGTEISFNYTIQPKTVDDAEIIDGRIYEFNTTLDNPWMRVTIEYGGSGPIRIYETRDYIKADVKDWDDGLARIFVEVKGKVPAVSERVAEVIALGIHVQDSEDGALSNVFIKVVNKELFSAYINQLDEKYNNLENRVNELGKKGVSIAPVKVKLNSAKVRIDEGKIYFDQGDYSRADSSFLEAESLLEEATNLSQEVETDYKIDSAYKKVEEMFAKMTELEILVQNLKKKGESTIGYEIKLENYKRDYSDLKSKIAQAEDFRRNSLYDDAQKLADEVVNTATTKISEIDALIGEISANLELTPTPEENKTPAPEKTPEDSWGENTPDFFSGITSWFVNNTRLAGMIAGGLVVLGIGGYFGYRGLKGYMKRRKWDELK